MDEKRCEWCGTLSPAEAGKCSLCRIPFSAPVPPPQDWSHLTGNIPVITAPLLEAPGAPTELAEAASSEPAPEPAADAAMAPKAPKVSKLNRAGKVKQTTVPAAAQAKQGSAPVVPQQVQREPVPAPPVQVAAGLAAPSAPPAAEVVPSIGEMVSRAARSETSSPLEAHVPGWRTPDDPTLKVFADQLERRERRPRGASAANRRGRRRRRQLVRLLVWLVALGLIAAFVLLAPDRMTSF